MVWWCTENIIFDILVLSEFRKYATCIVFSILCLCLCICLCLCLCLCICLCVMVWWCTENIIFDILALSEFRKYATCIAFSALSPFLSCICLCICVFVYLCAYLSSSLSSPDEARRCPLSDDVRYVGSDARIMETWLFFDDRLSGWRRRRRRKWRRRRKAVVR